MTNQTTPRGVSRRVVILGALSAIAIAAARIYASEGAAILLAARNPERLRGLADDLRARGAATVETAALDLADEAGNACQHLAHWSAQLGGIDHVLVIYGYLGNQKSASADAKELAKIVSVNFTSAVQWCEAAASLLRDQGRGSIVAISSVAADRGRQSNYAYGAAKAGLAIFMQGLAHSLARTGARAVVVKPGFVDTPMTDGMVKEGALWAKPEDIGRSIRRAAERGGPIQYAPSFWRMIMLVVRATPALVFHKTKF